MAARHTGRSWQGTFRMKHVLEYINYKTNVRCKLFRIYQGRFTTPVQARNRTHDNESPVKGVVKNVWYVSTRHC